MFISQLAPKLGVSDPFEISIDVINNTINQEITKISPISGSRLLGYVANILQPLITQIEISPEYYLELSVVASATIGSSYDTESKGIDLFTTVSQPLPTTVTTFTTQESITFNHLYRCAYIINFQATTYATKVRYDLSFDLTRDISKFEIPLIKYTPDRLFRFSVDKQLNPELISDLRKLALSSVLSPTRLDAVINTTHSNFTKLGSTDTSDIDQVTDEAGNKLDKSELRMPQSPGDTKRNIITKSGFRSTVTSRKSFIQSIKDR